MAASEWKVPFLPVNPWQMTFVLLSIRTDILTTLSAILHLPLKGGGRRASAGWGSRPRPEALRFSQRLFQGLQANSGKRRNSKTAAPSRRALRAIACAADRRPVALYA